MLCCCLFLLSNDVGCTDLYATATQLRTITDSPNIAARGAAYGIRSVAVDGNDVLALAKAAVR